ncbi:MAG: hypothetical protein R3B81_16175 [bacterium]
MTEMLVLALVKLAKTAVVTIAGVATALSPCAQVRCDVTAEAFAPAALCVEIEQTIEPASNVAPVAPPVRIETIFSPDLLIPPKIRDLGL